MSCHRFISQSSHQADVEWNKFTNLLNEPIDGVFYIHVAVQPVEPTVDVFVSIPHTGLKWLGSQEAVA